MTDETDRDGIAALLSASQTFARDLATEFVPLSVSGNSGSSPSLQKVFEISISDDISGLNSVTKSISRDTVAFSLDASVSVDGMERKLIFTQSVGEGGASFRATRFLDGVRTEHEISSMEHASSLLQLTMTQELCPGLVYKTPKDPDTAGARQSAFDYLCGCALHNQGELKKAGKPAFLGSSGFLTGSRIVTIFKADVDRLLINKSERSTSDTSIISLMPPDNINFLYYTREEGSGTRHVFRKGTCSMFTSSEGKQCKCVSRQGLNSWSKMLKRQQSAVQGRDPSAPIPSHLTHTFLAGSPSRAKNAILLSARENQALKHKIRILQQTCSSVVVSDEAAAHLDENLFCEPLVKAELEKIFPPGSEGLEVWNCILKNISNIAKHKGRRHGCRYPDVMLRLAGSLLAKVGRKKYDDLQKMWFLPSLRTATFTK